MIVSETAHGPTSRRGDAGPCVLWSGGMTYFFLKLAMPFSRNSAKAGMFSS